MIFTLNSKKRITRRSDIPIYTGEKNFDEIAVILPPCVDGNNTDDLMFRLHLIKDGGEFLTRTLDVRSDGSVKIAYMIVTASITNVALEFKAYIEMIKDAGETIGKSNVIPIKVNPLPAEENEIVPPEEQERWIDMLLQALQENTEAMRQIDGKEDVSNKVGSLDLAFDDDTKYPSAKATKEALAKKMGLITTTRGETPSSGFLYLVRTGLSQGAVNLFLALPVGAGDKRIAWYSDVSGKEDTSNKTTVIDNEADDDHYPTAKAVKDLVGDHSPSDGKSAYEIAVEHGYQGTEEEWLASLKGETGAAGSPGQNGSDGQDGYSPTATVSKSGSTATITITDKNGTTTAQISDGQDGAPGTNGQNGADGKSAYQVAVDNGYSGTEQQWLASLKGETGAAGSPGQNGSNGQDGVSCTHSWNGTVLSVTSASGTSSADLKGAQGDSYVLTSADKADIAALVVGLLPVYNGGVE